ncbi:tetratricopeptide repeat protein [Streptomyces phaeoluteigriseus]|uniref:Tetratricopeptide repeat protein n=1 Tax=Streptomyces phaeoluteigriseus TaxID=114686 RepID=A0ABY4Z2A7_9ACTN|nr:tetratricopeptide repeat protein [Streptomyces phaeoluteigriseus]USQ82894.1 tetratricopeptide repeat protein [Streptomyces phaeoluteigriseus]
MSRLSREKKRAQKYDGRPAVAVAPLDVHVLGGGPASIGGVPVVAADGQELQQAVLGHLHRIALATGHPVLATVHDERIGYVVPLRVEPDGSSHFAGEPLRVAPPREPGDRPSAPPTAASPTAAPLTAAPIVPLSELAEAAVPPAPTRQDKPTHFLRRQQAEPTHPAHLAHPVEPAEPVHPVEPVRPLEPQDGIPGAAVAPTGVFGPPPVMDRTPEDARPHPTPEPIPRLTPDPIPLPAPEAALGIDREPEPRPTPARGFDAVAEAVLGDDPRSLPGVDGAPALLGEPMARINEAVREGRTDTAAALAERTVTEASATLGPEHPEVLALRELASYIAYLAGDPVRSFHLSLDLARIHHGNRDAEAAYGNVQSAATAWRAVRDPFQGLNLGTELLTLWTELVTDGGPAAEDAEELESATSRMTRLARRARDSGTGPQGQGAGPRG